MTVSNSDQFRGGADRATLWLLRRVNQRYRGAIGSAVAGDGFDDLPQQAWWVVDALADQEQDASQLVALMGVSRQAVSKLVETLVAGGYLVRRPDERDRRRVRLGLTEKGGRAARAVRRAVDQVDARLADDLPPGGLEQLRDLLVTLGGLDRPEGTDRGRPTQTAPQP
jgi:DNA-binding MarR family transcriptional regulator